MAENEKRSRREGMSATNYMDQMNDDLSLMCEVTDDTIFDVSLMGKFTDDVSFDVSLMGEVTKDGSCKLSGIYAAMNKIFWMSLRKTIGQEAPDTDGKDIGSINVPQVEDLVG